MSFLFGGEGETRKALPFIRFAKTDYVRLRRVEFESLPYLEQKNKPYTTLQLYRIYFGGEGETRTLAPVSRPTPLAGAPRHQLEYFSIGNLLGYY